ncbi:hypothetical protein B0H14DRAFT_3135553 [Mycena olivaceomarginata]|nr:hypothetical protein B0H14DRAFT_3135553 [Mycena olivaceomarginata]
MSRQAVARWLNKYCRFRSKAATISSLLSPRLHFAAHMPDLPLMKRQIFELAFRSNSRNLDLKTTLCLVARRVQVWIDRIFYELVAIENKTAERKFLSLILKQEDLRYSVEVDHRIVVLADLGRDADWQLASDLWSRAEAIVEERKKSLSVGNDEVVLQSVERRVNNMVLSKLRALPHGLRECPPARCGPTPPTIVLSLRPHISSKSELGHVFASCEKMVALTCFIFCFR